MAVTGNMCSASPVRFATSLGDTPRKPLANSNHMENAAIAVVVALRPPITADFAVASMWETARDAKPSSTITATDSLPPRFVLSIS